MIVSTNHRAEYDILRWMISRCHDKNSPDYDRYGERGIRVCKRWRKKGGWRNFVMDMGPRPSKKYTIDRIKNNKGYEPDNCKWRTMKQNCRNRTNNHIVVYKGKKMSLVECIEKSKTKIGHGTIVSRLAEGWSLKKALTTPLQGTRIQVMYKGKKMSLRKAVLLKGWCVGTVYDRIRKTGFSPQQALDTPLRGH